LKTFTYFSYKCDIFFDIKNWLANYNLSTFKNQHNIIFLCINQCVECFLIILNALSRVKELFVLFEKLRLIKIIWDSNLDLEMRFETRTNFERNNWMQTQKLLERFVKQKFWLCEPNIALENKHLVLYYSHCLFTWGRENFRWDLLSLCQNRSVRIKVSIHWTWE
jgi:hypothetical protein